MFSNRAFPQAAIILGICAIVLGALNLKSHEDDLFQWAPIFGLGLLLICIGLGIHEFRQLEPSADPEASATLSDERDTSLLSLLLTQEATPHDVRAGPIKRILA